MREFERVVGRYEIVGRIGKGGMGVVHLARQPGLDRLVALKELVALDADDPTFAERFVREARIAGALSHPNIVTVFDYFEEDGTAFIAMEYLERGSLVPLVGRLSFVQVAGVLEGVLSGLAHAHEEGVVHRDLKPANLLVAKRGTIKIADFGISKALNLLGSQSLTATGIAVGSPTHMAPEQALAGDIGPWTDLYSAGVIAYELLVGQLPFAGTEAPMAILWKHVHEPVPPPLTVNPTLDPRLSAWLERMLAKQPGDRPQSALEASDELESIVVDLAGERWRREAALPGGGEADASEGESVGRPLDRPVGAVTPPERPAEPWRPPEPAQPAAVDVGAPSERPAIVPRGVPRRWIAGALAVLLVAAAVAAALVWRGSSSSTKIVETFSDPSNSWFLPFRSDEAIGRVQEGGFLVRTRGEGSFPVVVDDFDPDTKGDLPNTSPLPPSDARLEMDGTKLGGPESNQFGVACRENAPEADAVFYYLGISNDGEAFIEKYDAAADDGVVLREWRKNPAVRPVTQTNHLVAECRGGRDGTPVTLRLLVNDREVAKATDPDGVPVTFFGFFVGSDDPELDVRIDNFSLERL